MKALILIFIFYTSLASAFADEMPLRAIDAVSYQGPSDCVDKLVSQILKGNDYDVKQVIAIPIDTAFERLKTAIEGESVFFIAAKIQDQDGSMVDSVGTVTVHLEDDLDPLTGKWLSTSCTANLINHWSDITENFVEIELTSKSSGLKILDEPMLY